VILPPLVFPGYKFNWKPRLEFSKLLTNFLGSYSGNGALH
jgi:hypothetical protein